MGSGLKRTLLKLYVRCHAGGGGGWTTPATLEEGDDEALLPRMAALSDFVRRRGDEGSKGKGERQKDKLLGAGAFFVIDLAR